MKKQLQEKIFDAVQSLWKEAGLELGDVEVGVPPEGMGDFSCNVALKLSGKLGKSPQEIAKAIKEQIQSDEFFEKVETAGPGFLNFFVKKDELKKVLWEIEKAGAEYGSAKVGEGKTVMVEFGQPNTHKAITVGHLKSAVSGLAVARLFENSGYNVVKANYFGDVGMHVAKSTWAVMKKGLPEGFEKWSSAEKMKFVDSAYVEGARAFEEDEQAQAEIRQVNRDVYEAKENDNFEWYKKIRLWSIEHQAEVFARLGVSFDRQYPESEVHPDALRIVRENPEGIFKKSDGAVIFDGEKEGLGKWVFLTSEGNPTYSAKDLALAKKKFSEFDLDLGIVTTSVEQEAYFKAVIWCLEKIDPALKGKYKHLPFGWLLMGGKKTSSRMGKTIKCLEVLEEAEKIAFEKISIDKDYDNQTKKEIIEKVALSGLKFLILSHEFRSNINYDPEQFIKLNGFSGPFILYSYVRTQAVLRKLQGQGKLDSASIASVLNLPEEQDLLKQLASLPEVAQKAALQTAPHLVCNYLYETSQKFNAFYEKCPIAKAQTDEEKNARLALTAATGQVLKNGLWMLGIETVEKM